MARRYRVLNGLTLRGREFFRACPEGTCSPTCKWGKNAPPHPSVITAADLGPVSAGHGLGECGPDCRLNGAHDWIIARGHVEVLVETPAPDPGPAAEAPPARKRKAASEPPAPAAESEE